MDINGLDKLSDSDIIQLTEFLLSEWDWLKGKLRLDDIPTHAVYNSDNKTDIEDKGKQHDQRWSVNNILGV